MFAHPLLDFREQVLRDVDGAGFAFDFIGQVMGQVPLAGLAVAAGAAAFAAERHQTGGDKRAVEFELLNARVEVAADQGGMFGNLHLGPEYSRFMVLALLIRIATSQSEQAKTAVRRIFFWGND